MPTYAYACTECGHAFDEVQKFTDDALTTCPECGGRLRKVYGSIGVSFKGSGFYRNDSRAADTTAGGAKKETSKESASSGASSSGDSGSSSSSTSSDSGSSSSSSSSSPSKPAASGSSGSSSASAAS